MYLGICSFGSKIFIPSEFATETSKYSLFHTYSSRLVTWKLCENTHKLHALKFEISLQVHCTFTFTHTICSYIEAFFLQQLYNKVHNSHGTCKSFQRMPKCSEQPGHLSHLRENIYTLCPSLWSNVTLKPWMLNRILRFSFCFFSNFSLLISLKL